MIKKIVNLLLLIFITGISLLGGMAKIAQYPGEVVYYVGVGFTLTQLVLFGIAQLSGGLLLCISRTRVVGAILATLTFGVSTTLALAHQMYDVALVLLPVVLVGIYVCYRAIKITPNHHNKPGSTSRSHRFTNFG